MRAARRAGLGEDVPDGGRVGRLLRRDSQDDRERAKVGGSQSKQFKFTSIFRSVQCDQMLE